MTLVGKPSCDPILVGGSTAFALRASWRLGKSRYSSTDAVDTEFGKQLNIGCIQEIPLIPGIRRNTCNDARNTFRCAFFLFKCQIYLFFADAEMPRRTS